MKKKQVRAWHFAGAQQDRAALFDKYKQKKNLKEKK